LNFIAKKAGEKKKAKAAKKQSKTAA